MEQNGWTTLGPKDLDGGFVSIVQVMEWPFSSRIFARWLPPPPSALYQTYKQDHGPAAEMCARHIPGFERQFIDDPGCREDVVQLGAQCLLGLLYAALVCT